MEKQEPLPFKWIVADNAQLPDNIRSISADKLDADVLRKAFSLMTFPVNVVEIRVPLDEAYKAGIKGFLSRHDLSLDVLPDDYGIIKSPRDVHDRLCTYFESVASVFPGSEQDRHTLLQTRDLIVNMHNSFSMVWAEAASGMRIFGDGATDISYDNKLGFHTHGAMGMWPDQSPGYYLNFTASDVGTMFKDRADNVWVGQGWSYFLFPTAGHSTRIIAADHAYPSDRYGFKDQERATFISEMYPAPLKP